VEDELTGEGGLRVVSGQLTIGSSSGSSVSVSAGQCLIEAEPGEGDHPIIGALASGPCP